MATMTWGNTVAGSRREWLASIPWWRFSMLGGTLALTDEAVTFTPLLGFGRTRRFALEDFEEVSATADRPPRLRLTTSTGQSLDLMVVSARDVAMWTRDASARDQAVAAINERLTGK